jgi:kumamolisin
MLTRCKPYFKVRDSTGYPQGSWAITDLCRAYDFPTQLQGGGTIGIVELGGGWVQADMDSFFAGALPAQNLRPTITDVPIDIANSPNQRSDVDVEVALDIQVAATAYTYCTGKPATVRVYWCTSIADGVRIAMTECDVCSISWGSDESYWGDDDLQDMEAAATEATSQGMVVLAASGDNNAQDGGNAPSNVDAPASCPHVLGCGGTKKTANSEVVWNWNPGKTDGTGTGGGYSTVFPSQAFQAGVSGPGRMVPDVSANADPNTGYQIFLHGSPQTVGGTSAVAPLYAGLIAALGKGLGFISPTLWKNQTAFNDIVQGDNGYYRASVGPDPCTGIGSPIGSRIASLFATRPQVRARARAAPNLALPGLALTGSKGVISLEYENGIITRVTTTPG